MFHSILCSILTAPGTAAITIYTTITGNLLITAAVVIGLLILLVLTQFEILELIPILSVIIDWGELLFSEIGLVLIGYLILPGMQRDGALTTSTYT